MKTAIVTGGGRGIGKAISLSLAVENYTVVIVYNKGLSEAQDTVGEIVSRGGNAFAIKADVTNSSEVNSMTNSVLSKHKKIDLLVNNAGTACYGLLTDTTDKQFDDIFNVNVKGVFNCCRAVLPSMISRKEGSIVNISSVWGLSGASCEAVYSASKAAVIGLTKSLALELAPSNIRINAVAAGAVSTRMLDIFSSVEKDQLAKETPLSRMATPEEIASAVVFLTNNTFITGQTVNVSGGLVI